MVNFSSWRMNLFNKISVNVIVLVIYFIIIGQGYKVNLNNYGHAENDVFVSEKKIILKLLKKK